jgi:hypothetical protein
MALFPCSVDQQRYKGAQSTLYAALLTGSNAERSRLRLCGPHCQELLDYCRKYLNEVAENETQLHGMGIPLCSLCGADLDQPHSVFITAYPQGQPEVYFYGTVCSRDATIFRRTWQLTPS